MSATSFVTGATGFLGSAVAQALLDAGHSVRALTRTGTLPHGLEARGAEPIRGSLDDLGRMREAMAGVTTVFHVAADVSMWSARWAASHRTNVEGTRAVVEAALGAGVRRLVHTSSGSTIGKPLVHDGSEPTALDEEDRYNLEPLSMTYPHTKWLSEEVVRGAGERGLDYVITHPTMILGPGDHKHNLLPLFRAARRGMPFVPRGWRTLCDVRDVARGHLLAAERGVRGGRYILGGESMPFREVMARIARATGGRAPLSTVPDAVMMAIGRGLAAVAELTGTPPRVTPEMARQSTFRVHLSSARAERELGYACRPLDQTIADAVAWYRAEGLL